MGRLKTDQPCRPHMLFRHYLPARTQEDTSHTHLSLRRYQYTELGIHNVLVFLLQFRGHELGRPKDTVATGRVARYLGR